MAVALSSGDSAGLGFMSDHLGVKVPLVLASRGDSVTTESVTVAGCLWHKARV